MEIIQQPVVIMSGLAVAVVVILFATFARMLRKVGPNQARNAAMVLPLNGDTWPESWPPPCAPCP